MHSSRKDCNFALAIGDETPGANNNSTLGAVVQLVRMPACHAGGRGFKSRPHRRGERKSSMVNFGYRLLFFVTFEKRYHENCFLTITDNNNDIEHAIPIPCAAGSALFDSGFCR